MAFERLLAKQPKTEDVPADAPCYICLDGAALLRGCACRGATGWTHVDCLAEMAARNAWVTVDGRARFSRWTCCGTCHQTFFGALSTEMCRRMWRYYRDSPASDDTRCTLRTVAFTFRKNYENDAADRVDEDVLRGLGRDHPEMLRAEVERAVSVLPTRPDTALEILTGLRFRIAQCAVGSIRWSYADIMALVLALLDRPQDALRFANESVELATAIRGPESETTLHGTGVYARLLIEVGRVDEGIARLKRVHDTQTRVLGADHRDTRQTKRVLDEEAALERARPS
mmetsp:Transcript_9646/g.39352  ORF Transcript_9646/g.39352 Transcript_9646/m.39352 type:complete len:286 (+) Transcript_9646:123-980(+)